MVRYFSRIFLIFNFSFLIGITSCSVTKQISRQANTILLNDSAISKGHVGISIYDPASATYWYNHDATKYFVPASNTKLFTLYAGMKYLGDSLVAARLQQGPSALSIYPSGDPTFLDPEYKFQPLFDKLASFKTIYVNNNAWRSDALGNGWAWNDYNEAYMAERSSFPIYGNLIEFSLNKGVLEINSKMVDVLSHEDLKSPLHFDPETRKVSSDKFIIERPFDKNDFYIRDANSSFRKNSIPFKTDPEFVASLLKDTLKAEDVTFFRSAPPIDGKVPETFIIHSQPVDSLFKPMMHRSDNFFAEQTLLMASNEHLGYMSDDAMIDTLLRSDLKDAPQKPKWVDGSGLSRYNLFTPQDFVYILDKIKKEFGLDRIKNILATGGTGTLSSYFKNAGGFIYAKTGTLSNNCALSGFLITKKGKLLIFSVLVNNYQSGATPVRRAVEQFLLGIREKY